VSDLVSVIIPARNEEFLEKTIRNVLDKARGDIEVIVVLDGYKPDPRIELTDDRVRFEHFEKSIGQRQAINHAARVAKGKYIMKLDAHCAVDKGFDVHLVADCEYDWTVVPRMYNLQIAEHTCKKCDKVHASPKPQECECGSTDFSDKDVWKPKRHKRTDYMYISSPDRKDKPFRAQYYESETKDNLRRNSKSDKQVDDIMCCMGPCFFMHKDRFWELGGCDEGHGGWGQQGIEVALKAWLSGGSLKVNKNTWFAHWFRTGGTDGFPWPASGRAHQKARDYSQNIWLKGKWPQAKRDLQWVVDKFNPPGWKKNMRYGEKATRDTFDNKKYYKHVISGKDHPHFPRWFGTKLIKYPNDIILYANIIQENKPDFLIESGTCFGGSALFFAHMMDLVGHGQVITVDIKDHNPPKHPRIKHIVGRATSDETLEQIKETVKGKTVMASLDSDHHRRHVKRELGRYGDFVTPGQYMVVEDCNFREIGYKDGPEEAIEWFMSTDKGKAFEDMKLEDKFLFSCNPGGWLKRKKQ